MKRVTIFIFAVVLAAGLAGSALAQGRHDEKQHGYDTQKAESDTAKKSAAKGRAEATEDAQEIIELKDGGKLIIRKDGTMYHADASGARVKMRDGTVMISKDGDRYMMKNDRLWKMVTEKARSPGHP